MFSSPWQQETDLTSEGYGRSILVRFKNTSIFIHLLTATQGNVSSTNGTLFPI
jgi:hypothetical protein